MHCLNTAQPFYRPSPFPPVDVYLVALTGSDSRQAAEPQMGGYPWDRENLRGTISSTSAVQPLSTLTCTRDNV
jgi:hypothetical protein